MHTSSIVCTLSLPEPQNSGATSPGILGFCCRGLADLQRFSQKNQWKMASFNQVSQNLIYVDYAQIFQYKMKLKF